MQRWRDAEHQTHQSGLIVNPGFLKDPAQLGAGGVDADRKAFSGYRPDVGHQRESVETDLALSAVGQSDRRWCVGGGGDADRRAVKLGRDDQKTARHSAQRIVWYGTGSVSDLRFSQCVLE